MATFKGIPTQIKDEIKKKASRERTGLPHLSELAEHFVNQAGGARALSRMLYGEWTAAKPGSLTRARILDLITRVWRFSNEATGRTQDLGLLSNDDLDRALQELIENATEDLTDGQPAGPTEEQAQSTQKIGCLAASPGSADPSTA